MIKWFHKDDSICKFVPYYRFCGTQSAVNEFLQSKDSIEEALGCPIIMVDCVDTMHGILIHYKKVEPTQSTSS